MHRQDAGGPASTRTTTDGTMMTMFFDRLPVCPWLPKRTPRIGIWLSPGMPAFDVRSLFAVSPARISD